MPQIVTIGLLWYIPHSRYLKSTFYHFSILKPLGIGVFIKIEKENLGDQNGNVNGGGCRGTIASTGGGGFVTRKDIVCERSGKGSLKQITKNHEENFPIHYSRKS